MKARIFALTLAIAGLSLTACDNGGKGEVPDSMKSFSESGFNAGEPAFKSSAVTEDQLHAILMCEEPSTSTRLKKDAYATSVEVTKRDQTNLQSPLEVVSKVNGFSTQNKGQTYIKRFELSQHSVGGISALPSGPYSYIQNCTDVDNCVDVKPEYIKMDQMYELGHLQRVQDAYSEAAWKIQQSAKVRLNCQFQTDLDAEKVDPTIQEGTYDLAGKTYPAVQYTSVQNGEVSCNGSVVGKGRRVRRTVVIGDMLPGTEAASSVGGVGIGCVRTQVRDMSEDTWNGKTILGTDTRISHYSVSGELPSVEEYEQETKDYTAMVANLEDAVRIANRRFEESKTAYATAQATTAEKATALEEAEAKILEKQQELDAAKAETDPDPIKIQAAEKAVEDAKARRDAAGEIHTLAQQAEGRARDARDAAELALGKAQRELADYKANNKPNQ